MSDGITEAYKNVQTLTHDHKQETPYTKQIWAYLEKVEADNAALRLKVQEYNSALDAMTARYVVLETLVKALPVLDMRFDSVAVGPLGWTVGGVTFGKVTEANAYSALLQYRATLAAKDAGKETDNGV